jgi:hypothetical protein
MKRARLPAREIPDEYTSGSERELARITDYRGAMKSGLKCRKSAEVCTIRHCCRGRVIPVWLYPRPKFGALYTLVIRGLRAPCCEVIRPAASLTMGAHNPSTD